MGEYTAVVWLNKHLPSSSHLRFILSRRINFPKATYCGLERQKDMPRCSSLLTFTPLAMPQSSRSETHTGRVNSHPKRAQWSPTSSGMVTWCFLDSCQHMHTSYMQGDSIFIPIRNTQKNRKQETNKQKEPKHKPEMSSLF